MILSLEMCNLAWLITKEHDCVLSEVPALTELKSYFQTLRANSGS